MSLSDETTPITFGFIVNRSTALAVSSLTSKSVGGLFSGRSIGVIASLLDGDTGLTSISGDDKPRVRFDDDVDLG